MRGMKRLFIASLLISCTLLIGLPATAQLTLEKANICSLTAIIDTPVTATTQVVAAPSLTTTTQFINGVGTSVTSGSPKIKICSMDVFVNQSGTAVNYGLAYGTGSNCATGITNLTPQWIGTISVKERLYKNYGADGPLILPAGKALCLRLSGAPTGAQIEVHYKLEP